MHAIPTLYSGIQFRSRLEAKWAAFFDAVGWPWQYEPIDLKRYIPDFVLPFYKPLLVEVKPAGSIEELERYTGKIDSSGWEGEALLVGTALFDGDWDRPIIGLLRSSVPDTATYLTESHELCGFDSCGVFWGNWNPAGGMRCRECGRLSLFNTIEMFDCRVSGCYDGDHHLGQDNGALAAAFAAASNLTQWRF